MEGKGWVLGKSGCSRCWWASDGVGDCSCFGVKRGGRCTGTGLMVRLDHVGRTVIVTVVKVTAGWTFIDGSVSHDPAVPLDIS